MRIEKLVTDYGVDLHWVYFPLHPETAEAGMTLEELFAGRNMDIPAMQAHLKNLMEQEGLSFSDRTMTFNSRLAQELAKWADGLPEGKKAHTALYHAYFVEGKNIGKIDELLTITEKAGLDVKEARDVLENRRFKNQVDQDWIHAYEMNITGVPAFVAGQFIVSGAQPYKTLERMMQHAGISKRVHTL
ncbi:MAG: DsbA family protein [SAR324 cluster bacterium]|nr:DsbA family protein [SAR324 cluster bacterium]